MKALDISASRQTFSDFLPVFAIVVIDGVKQMQVLIDGPVTFCGAILVLCRSHLVYWVVCILFNDIRGLLKIIKDPVFTYPFIGGMEFGKFLQEHFLLFVVVRVVSNFGVVA